MIEAFFSYCRQNRISQRQFLIRTKPEFPQLSFPAGKTGVPGISTMLPFTKTHIQLFTSLALRIVISPFFFPSCISRIFYKQTVIFGRF